MVGRKLIDGNVWAGWEVDGFLSSFPQDGQASVSGNYWVLSGAPNL